MSDKEGKKKIEMSDNVASVFDATARLLMTVGGLAAAGGIGFLLFTLFRGVDGDAAQIAANIDTFGTAAIIGAIAFSLGAAWTFWAEEILGAILLILAAALYFSPVYLPMTGAPSTDALQPVYDSIRDCGIFPGILGIIALFSEGYSRLRLRFQEGSRADHLKIGKGVKEEKDIRNVFLGKCWQLPYCRKFVRERCPIFHAKRTCWSERVGCMCEESVIRNAMEGNVIPADSVAASKYIPSNPKLTPGQKADRCRQCVIYNEHQKHKYQLMIGGAIVLTIGSYVGVRGPAGQTVKRVLVNADDAISQATFSAEKVQTDASKGTSIEGGMIPYHEILVAVMFLVAFAYAVRFIEYLIFKMKI
jgi:hypothetical protein